MQAGRYDLLGVKSPLVGELDGRYHPIQVTVKRPGADVRARRGVYAPTSREASRTDASRGSAGLRSAVSGVLPDSGAQLALAAAAFRASDRKSAVAVVISGVLEKLVTTDVEVEIAAFRPETGDRVESIRQRLEATPDATGRYEVPFRLVINPGRCQLRAGVAPAGQPTASVYADVDVPDFSRQGLSVSGLVLRAARSTRSDALTNLLSFVPTTRRTFTHGDDISAFLRVYPSQEESPRPPVMVTALVVDEGNQYMMLPGPEIESPASQREGTGYSFKLPVQTLPPGEYMLFVETASESQRNTRAIRFRLQ